MSGIAEPPEGRTPQRRAGWQLPGVSGSSPRAPESGRPAASGRDASRTPETRGALPPSPVLVGGIAGEARNISQGTASEVTFRLERHDASAGRTSMVTVRLWGNGVAGFVSEGDWVEVQGKSKRGFLNAKAAVNRTSGAEFRSTTAGCRRVGVVVFVIFFVISLLIIVGIFISVLHG
jgi:hypothetical protein